MSVVNLKESNLIQVKAFFQIKCRSNDIQGSKLEALYKLIQKKGELIEGSKLNGEKALNIGDGMYISLIHKPVKKNNFFPCSLKSIHLQELKS